MKGLLLVSSLCCCLALDICNKRAILKPIKEFILTKPKEVTIDPSSYITQINTLKDLLVNVNPMFKELKENITESNPTNTIQIPYMYQEIKIIVMQGNYLDALENCQLAKKHLPPISIKNEPYLRQLMNFYEIERQYINIDSDEAGFRDPFTGHYFSPQDSSESNLTRYPLYYNYKDKQIKQTKENEKDNKYKYLCFDSTNQQSYQNSIPSKKMANAVISELMTKLKGLTNWQNTMLNISKNVSKVTKLIPTFKIMPDNILTQINILLNRYTKIKAFINFGVRNIQDFRRITLLIKELLSNKGKKGQLKLKSLTNSEGDNINSKMTFTPKQTDNTNIKGLLTTNDYSLMQMVYIYRVYPLLNNEGHIPDLNGYISKIGDVYHMTQEEPVMVGCSSTEQNMCSQIELKSQNTKCGNYLALGLGNPETCNYVSKEIKMVIPTNCKNYQYNIILSNTNTVGLMTCNNKTTKVNIIAGLTTLEKKCFFSFENQDNKNKIINANMINRIKNNNLVTNPINPATQGKYANQIYFYLASLMSAIMILISLITICILVREKCCNLNLKCCKKDADNNGETSQGIGLRWYPRYWAQTPLNEPRPIIRNTALTGGTGAVLRN